MDNDKIREQIKAIVQDKWRTNINGIHYYESHQFDVDAIILAVTTGDSIEEAAIEILEDSNEDSTVKFVAFFCLQNYYRRIYDYQKFVDSYDKYVNKNEEWKSFLYLSMIELQRYTLYGGSNQLTKEKLQRARDIAKNANSGFCHLYALLTAIYYEKHGIDPAFPNEISTALDSINRAFILESQEQDTNTKKSGKYHATEGRLLALAGQYEEAISALEKAIELEIPTSKDYSLRISDYYAQITKIEGMKNKAELDNKLQKTKSELDDRLQKIQTERVKTLELMGLLVAVLSFIMGTLQITGSCSAVSVLGTAGLILVLMGTVVLAFCGASFLLRSFKPISNLCGYPSALLIGLALILGGLLIAGGYSVIRSILLVFLLSLLALLLYIFGDRIYKKILRK